MVLTRAFLAATVAACLAACAADPAPQPATKPGASRPHRLPMAAAPPSAQARGARSAAGLPAAPEPAAPERHAAEAAATYRVQADGIVGCTDPHAVRILHQLRNAAGASPRLLAQAHQDGGCMTVFRASEWTAEAVEGELIRLRLADASAQGRPVSLYFLRDEVTRQRDD